METIVYGDLILWRFNTETSYSLQKECHTSFLMIFIMAIWLGFRLLVIRGFTMAWKSLGQEIIAFVLCFYIRICLLAAAECGFLFFFSPMT